MTRRRPLPDIINFDRCRQGLIIGPPAGQGVEAFDAWMIKQCVLARRRTADASLPRPCDTVDEIAANLDQLIEDLEAEVDRLVSAID